jgi:hypothetical protein
MGEAAQILLQVPFRQSISSIAISRQTVAVDAQSIVRATAEIGQGNVGRLGGNLPIRSGKMAGR